jgi:ketosteroid isomerase-like protein
MPDGVLTWNAVFDDHPARVMSRRSIDSVCRREKSEWLALYSPDALIEDPVGPSPFDPQGIGHRGHERLSAYWDGTIATTERVDFIVDASYTAGNEVANVGSVIAYLPGGVHLQTFGVYVYTVGGDGLIKSLRTYWDFDRAMGTVTSAP